MPGRVAFRVAPHAHWFPLIPGLVTDVSESPDRRLLRVEIGESAFVIQTLDPAG